MYPPRVKCGCGRFTPINKYCGYCGKDIEILGIDLNKALRERKRLGRIYFWVGLVILLAIMFSGTFLISLASICGVIIKDPGYAMDFLMFLATLFLLTMMFVFSWHCRKKFPFFENPY